MTREEMIEALKTVLKELGMSVAEYAEYANKKYDITDDAIKVKNDNAMAFRTGAVKTQIETILSAIEGR